jgi:hypothetical protein
MQGWIAGDAHAPGTVEHQDRIDLRQPLRGLREEVLHRRQIAAAAIEIGNARFGLLHYQRFGFENFLRVFVQQLDQAIGIPLGVAQHARAGFRGGEQKQRQRKKNAGDDQPVDRTDRARLSCMRPANHRANIKRALRPGQEQQRSRA